MITLETIRKGPQGILMVGNHLAIAQSILDFDMLAGKKTPSLFAIVTGSRRAQKLFWGRGEVLIPCYPDIASAQAALKEKKLWMLNVQSGRRALASTLSFFEAFPASPGGTIFAENVPERHAAELIERFGEHKLIAGPANVGFLVPGALKLGAIGGVDAAQIEAGKLAVKGNIAVCSTSGGMTNELIRAVAAAGKRVSFAVSLGGDRFPILSLTKVLELAEHDSATEALVYFGELGGTDEYEIAAAVRSKQFTKPVLAYIAGTIDESFEERVQFGHAKALVQGADESASAKRTALRDAGALAPETFPAFLKELAKLPQKPYRESAPTDTMKPLENRKASILSTREVTDLDALPSFAKKGKLVKREPGLFARAILEALLGDEVRSPITVAFAEAVFMLLIDHGGEVSGAVNTMITARAGKDLPSSLASGLLTVGPRFGGAIGAAAEGWLSGVSLKEKPAAFVERKTKAGELVAGIGHRKYRIGIPDPRVDALSQFASLLAKHPHYDFARGVEAVTTGKSGSLILNVDGAIAALLLDILAECEKVPQVRLQELARAEFFNAFFVIPRSVGFIAHFLEQKENDEGLFRLPEELLFVRRAEKVAPVSNKKPARLKGSGKKSKR